MENYKNLNFSAEQINQKLAWVGDKSKLATTLQETPVNQIMFTKDQKTLKTIIDANNQIITVETNDMNFEHFHRGRFSYIQSRQSKFLYP